ncbi:hypothetical protein PENTCL1PPCAC_3341, partial [Pristionchus entomophagus]
FSLLPTTQCDLDNFKLDACLINRCEDKSDTNLILFSIEDRPDIKDNTCSIFIQIKKLAERRLVVFVYIQLILFGGLSLTMGDLTFKMDKKAEKGNTFSI